MPPLRVLIAEDDASIRELLVHHFQAEGFSTTAVADGNMALRAARDAADVVVLDVGLPAVDGFEVVRRLRREQRLVPVVMLTARGDEVDRVVALELGADDYVVKPFSTRELLARVKALARRAGSPQDAPGVLLKIGEVEIDERARDVRIRGAIVHLKPREFSLLFTLASNPGVAMSRRTLLDRCWGFDFCGDERTVDVHVRRLRVAVESDARDWLALETVHGYGYKFVRR